MRKWNKADPDTGLIRRQRTFLKMQTPGDFYRRDRDWHPPACAPEYKSSITRSPRYRLVAMPHSLSETTGPVFGHNDIDPMDRDLITNFAQTGAAPIGERIILHGQVLDQNCRPVPRTLIEIWQANAGGRYRHRNDHYFAPIDPNFGGCGRTLTDENGFYTFHTVKPGAYPWPNFDNSWRPAHIHFSLFGEAYAQRLITQCYFEGDPLINLCPIVQAIPDPNGVDMLVAKLDMDTTIPFDSIAYRFDIVLRGRHATPFESRPEGN